MGNRIDHSRWADAPRSSDKMDLLSGKPDLAGTGKLNLKFVPSRARYYLKCPYFLYLSNIRDIYMPYSQLASRKGSLFEKRALGRISEQRGHDIAKAVDVIDLLNGNGLYILNKKVDTEFYSTDDVGLRVSMLKPDLILSEKTESGVKISVLEIKNADCVMPYHYLQAYVYKLTLEKLLKQRTGVQVCIGMSIIHRKGGFAPDSSREIDLGIVRGRIDVVTLDSLVVRDFEIQGSDFLLQQTLQRIATLRPNVTECSTCPGAGRCKHVRLDGLKYIYR